MATLTEINTRIEAAVSALEAGDYETCLLKLEAARIFLLGTPDSEFKGERIEFKREEFENSIKSLKARAAAAQTANTGGVRTILNEYRRG